MGRTIAVLALVGAVLAAFAVAIVSGDYLPIFVMLFLAGSGVAFIMQPARDAKIAGALLLLLAVIVPLASYSPVQGDERTLVAEFPAWMQQPLAAAAFLFVPTACLALYGRGIEPRWMLGLFALFILVAIVVVLTRDADSLGSPEVGVVLPAILCLGAGAHAGWLLSRTDTEAEMAKSGQPAGTTPARR